MNNSLDRLIGGIIATLRTHVIPNVTDGYARGQAIGVIDLLNNIAPRLEWARAPLAEAVAERRNTIRAVRARLPQSPAGGTELSDEALACATSTELAAERDRLDGEIADLITWTHGDGARDHAAAAAIALLRQHVRDELKREMKLTKKPLFAEISKAAGSGDNPN
jgi:mersacidin/lichenicidin family type 2 lantibiotic